jgi:drug/metabolite transporter (DMT)-like permease
MAAARQMTDVSRGTLGSSNLRHMRHEIDAMWMGGMRFNALVGIGLINWLILLFLGLNTLFAYGLLSIALQYIEANKISVILILNPLLTFALMAIISHTSATWINHESYSAGTLMGAIIALAGAILTIFRKISHGNRENERIH